eukprot:814098-Karenia_brevis.AAC.1
MKKLNCRPCTQRKLQRTPLAVNVVFWTPLPLAWCPGLAYQRKKKHFVLPGVKQPHACFPGKEMRLQG